MRKITDLLVLLCLLIGVVIIDSCKKDVGLPVLTTKAVSNITINSATSGGEITNNGGADITAKGVCWSTTANPKITDTHSNEGTGSGSFTSLLINLNANTTYYVVAYATNSAGTAYGKPISFLTSELKVPTLTTTAISAVTYTTAASGGNITSDGGKPVTARGVCWTTSGDPSINSDKTSNETGTGSFTSNITGLLPNTTYRVAAYATNSVGTAYGAVIPFTTNPIVAPTVTTADVTEHTLNTAVAGGNITDAGGGVITAGGVCWGKSENPDISGNKTTDVTVLGVFTKTLTNLEPGQTYHVRAYATNSAGTAYGVDKQFTTDPIVAPTVTTTAVSGTTYTTAVSGGNITNDGGGTILAGGVCWSLSSDPSIVGNPNKTADATGTGIFTSNISGLEPGKTYHVRAYATNSAGTSYGADVPFSTDPVVAPTVTTTAVSGTTYTTVNTGGNITNAGGGTISAGGVCWGANANPDITGNKTTDATGIGVFTSHLSSLLPGTIYHVRAYATNSAGTSYGADIQFSTNAIVAPTVTTAAVTGTTYTTANTGGNITNAGGGTISAGGVCWGTSANPDIIGSKTSDATGTGVFTSHLSSLLPGTIYHVRAYATNSAGTSYGSDIQFTTNAIVAPTVSTTAVTAFTVNTAVAGGNVTDLGGGTLTAKGVCWSLSPSPSIADPKTDDGTTIGPFTSNLTGLVGNSTYYLRAYATNGAGTSYGSVLSFRTYAAIDADGNGYYSVTLGSQTWMTENLKTSRYRNNDLIGTTTADVSGLPAPAYQWAYNNNENNVATYGRLYTWYAITDTREVCPLGWHVPTDAEWATLTSYLRSNGYSYTPGSDDIGKSMAATSGWDAFGTPGTIGNDQASNNTSGFTALPGGFRDAYGAFTALGQDGHWRSTTESTADNAWYYSLDYDFGTIYRNDFGKRNGYSVRCVK
jgi:uncharacterized protein (TIGR02145 family)